MFFYLLTFSAVLWLCTLIIHLQIEVRYWTPTRKYALTRLINCIHIPLLHMIFTCQRTYEHHLALIRRLWSMNHYRSARGFMFSFHNALFKQYTLGKNGQSKNFLNLKCCSYIARQCQIVRYLLWWRVTVNIFAASGHKYFSVPPPNPIMGSVPVCPNVVFTQPSAAAAFFSLQSSQQHNPLLPVHCTQIFAGRCPALRCSAVRYSEIGKSLS